MSKHQVNELGYILTGAVTSAGIGSFVFQMLGTVVLGVLGALGGWFAIEYIKPKVKPFFDKYLKPKAQ